jgi:probable lipoprotein NlpC
MSWSNQFVGIPFADLGRTRAGADCWGLVCLVYREALAIMLPDYVGYGSAHEHAEIAALVEGAEQSPIWRRITEPKPFDILVFRRGPWASHVGLVVQSGQMLHMAAGDCAKIEDWQGGRWGARLTGVFRYTAVEGSIQHALNPAFAVPQ